MGHTHVVTDTDARFVIDIASRKIKKATGDKPALMQYDHNSERYTFEMPRYIEGHDMSTCNQVGVHYLNIEQANKKEHSGLYEVEDLTIAGEDESKVVFSWLIKRGATQYHGKLHFLVSFACTADGLIEYAWHTDFFTETAVNKGLDATGAFETEYVEIIERWKASVMAHFTGELDKWKTATAAEIRREASEEIRTLISYVTPQVFGAVGDGVTDDTAAFQQAIDSLTGDVRVLLIPHAVYRLTGSIEVYDKTNIRLLGLGHPVLKFDSQEAVTSGFFFSRYKNIEVSGVAFKSTRDKLETPPGGHGDVLYAGSNILALHLVGGDGATFRDNRFDGMLSDYWILGETNKNILVDGWVSENATMPAYCSHLDNAEFRHSKITPATQVGAGNHAFYISVKSVGVRIIDCECVAQDNTFSSLISHYDAHDETDESIQPKDLLVRDFRGKGARLYVGNRFATVRFENVDFEQIYSNYLTSATKENGAVYSDVECVLSHVKDIALVGCRFVTMNAGVVYDGPNSENVLIESSTLNLGTDRLVLARSKTVIKNSDFVCGTFIYSGEPKELLDVYVAGCRIKASTYIFSRRNNKNGVFVFANNVIYGNKGRFYYSGETSDCTGVTLLNNCMFNMSDTFKLGSADEIANIVSLNNYVNGTLV